ncbi:PQQ-binding-like beta-propeller repeat protein [Bacteroidota bacterium]
MKKLIFAAVMIILAMIQVHSQEPGLDPELQWPSYRGYMARGVLDNANLPDSWNVETGENILWKSRIEGLGLSSPVIWGNKLFITTAVSKEDDGGFKTGIYGSVGSVDDESEHEWKIICLDKNTGEQVWEKTACQGVPKQKRHPKSSHANSTLACDGNYVVAFFGSEGLYCYDMNGELQWKKDFGLLRSVFFAVENAEWEFASSPIIHEGVVIIQCDVMENSFVAAYDVASGDEIWKKDRKEYPGWCTPNIYYEGDKTRVALNGYLHRGAYDFYTGEEIWKMSGGGDIQIPTPILYRDLIFFNSAHGKQSPIYAIHSTAKGDLTLGEDETSNEFVRWSIQRGGSYMQTMLVYRELLYNANWNGSVVCFQAETGEEVWRNKAGSGNSYIASPVASDGKIYVIDDQGMVYILRAGSAYELLAQNDLGEICMVSPAISENTIFFRTINHMIAVSDLP